MGQCSKAYLVSFFFSYTGGLIFGIVSVLRVLAQYKEVTMIRQQPRFLLRNRMMRALGREQPNSKYKQSLHDEKGNILDMHMVQQSVLFAALQVSTAYLCLVVLGYLGTALFSALLCGYFWTDVVPRVRTQLGTFAVVILANFLMFKAVG